MTDATPTIPPLITQREVDYITGPLGPTPVSPTLRVVVDSATGRRTVVPASVTKPVWQEARDQIDAWEKEHPDAEHVVLILDASEEIHMSVAGPLMKPSYAAGLCFDAATMAVAP